MKKPTRAEVLAEYLGLNERTHPACFRDAYRCNQCGTPYGGTQNGDCINRGCSGLCEYMPTIALPNPLAPGHKADAWLGVLVRWKGFWTIHAFEGEFACHLTQGAGCEVAEGRSTDPVPAIVRAMMAADPALAAKMEGAEGC